MFCHCIFCYSENYFGKQVKHFFSKKNSYGINIKLVVGDGTLNYDEKIAKELNTFFQNAIANLNIQKNSFI